MARFVLFVCFVFFSVTATPINDIKDAKTCTKPNEIWTDCAIAVCRPLKCHALGRPVMCASVIGPCRGGCVCKEGYVENETEDCIDAKTCPSCGGDPNAQTGCGNQYCAQTCESLRGNTGNETDTARPKCDSYCEFNGCDCRKGYILDTAAYPRRCVLPEDCINVNQN